MARAATALTSDSRACTACSKAKRKCDRRSPACQRCMTRKQPCSYPGDKTSSSLPSSSTPSVSSATPESHTGRAYGLLPYSAAALQWSPYVNDMDLSIFTTPPLQPPPLDVSPVAGSDSAVIVTSASWFLAPETWVVDHTSIPMPPNFDISDLRSLLRVIQGWLGDWIDTGSNVFIHSKLYADTFPACVQTAYTAFAAYRTSTAQNVDVVLRIVNERASELVAEVQSMPATCLTIFDQLAYLHALLVYQVIGLLDGDIRAHHLADGRALVFQRLLHQIIESCGSSAAQAQMGWDFAQLASRATDDANANANANAVTHVPGADAHHSAPSHDRLLWRAWLIAESVRRTWLVGMGLHAAYSGLQQGWVPCPGDIPFTSRPGMWMAASPEAWAPLCAAAAGGEHGSSGGSHSGRLMMRRFHAPRVYCGGKGADVDDFGKVMLEITYGRERMREWLRLGEGLGAD